MFLTKAFMKVFIKIKFEAAVSLHGNTRLILKSPSNKFSRSRMGLQGYLGRNTMVNM
jgi:hypothetical protein